MGSTPQDVRRRLGRVPGHGGEGTRSTGREGGIWAKASFLYDLLVRSVGGHVQSQEVRDGQPIPPEPLAGQKNFQQDPRRAGVRRTGVRLGEGDPAVVDARRKEVGRVCQRGRGGRSEVPRFEVVDDASAAVRPWPWGGGEV
ncbi:MAG: hypothetical protein HZB55_11415 [Deltaproteobacteria bacterium]|nr:hypothetical protein [Deltaproteobacteria bacterium]